MWATRRSNTHQLARSTFNEARSTTLIGHPGIVQVFDFGKMRSGSAYFVMEFLAGESLGSRLRRDPRLPPELVIALTIQAADALAAAHDAGIVHRDLKPDNLYLVPDHAVNCGIRVKVLDFGIAKLATEAVAGGIKTSTKAIMGTPAYMSPEQCRGAGGVDQRSDIYSLGCIVYEMTVGQRPFSADLPTGDLVVAHLHQQPPSPRAVAHGVPASLEAVILRMLAKRLEDRYQSMVELIADLQRIMRGEIPSSNFHTPLPPTIPYAGGTLPDRPPPTTLGSAAGQSIPPQSLVRRSRKRIAAMVGFASVVVLGLES